MCWIITGTAHTEKRSSHGGYKHLVMDYDKNILRGEKRMNMGRKIMLQVSLINVVYSVVASVHMQNHVVSGCIY